LTEKKNIFKLAQGEYVAAEVLEGIYNKNKYTTQLWVYGDSQERYLIAVGAVNKITILNLAKQCSLTTKDIEEICENKEVIAEVLNEINALAKENKRQPFEYIKRLHLHPSEFDTSNDLATPTLKLKRPQLRDFFQARIELMYASIHEEEATNAKKERKKSKKGDKVKKSESERPDKNKKVRPKTSRAQLNITNEEKVEIEDKDEAKSDEIREKSDDIDDAEDKNKKSGDSDSDDNKKNEKSSEEEKKKKEKEDSEDNIDKQKAYLNVTN